MKSKVSLYVVWVFLLTVSHQVFSQTISIKDGKCDGEFSKLKEIQESGIPSPGLRSGVPCVSGDFDSDGVRDVALMPFIELPKNGSMIKSHWRVVFLLLDKQQAISKAIVVPNRLQNSLGLFSQKHSDKELAKLKNYKCPYQNKSDGIVAWGEGDSTNIFLLDEKRNLKSYKCASEGD